MGVKIYIIQTYQVRGHVLLSCGNHFKSRAFVLLHLQNVPCSRADVLRSFFCMLPFLQVCLHRALSPSLIPPPPPFSSLSPMGAPRSLIRPFPIIGMYWFAQILLVTRGCPAASLHILKIVVYCELGLQLHNNFQQGGGRWCLKKKKKKIKGKKQKEFRVTSTQKAAATLFLLLLLFYGYGDSSLTNLYCRPLKWRLETWTRNLSVSNVVHIMHLLCLVAFHPFDVYAEIC